MVRQIEYNHKRLRHSCWDHKRKFGRCTNLVNQIHQDQAIVKVSQEHHIFGDIILSLFYHVFELAFIAYFSRSNAI